MIDGESSNGSLVSGGKQGRGLIDNTLIATYTLIYALRCLPPWQCVALPMINRTIIVPSTYTASTMEQLSFRPKTRFFPPIPIPSSPSSSTLPPNQTSTLIRRKSALKHGTAILQSSPTLVILTPTLALLSSIHHPFDSLTIQEARTPFCFMRVLRSLPI